MFVCLHGTTRLPLDGFSWNFCTWVFFENLPRKFKFHLNLTRIMGALHEDQCTCLIISRSTLLGKINVSDKSYREDQNTHFFSISFFRNVLLEIMWKNVELGRPEMTIWHMHNACWIAKVTNTHTENVILIAFPLQQWLHKHSSVLRYMYIALSVTA